jgi:hypothetical protein
MNYINEKIVAYWKLATGLAHMSIGIIAALAFSGVLPLSDTLLAFLLAWAQTCTAIHRLHQFGMEL